MTEERVYELEVGPEFFDEIEKQAGEKGLSEVVMVAPVSAGKILLHTKSFYSEGSYRLPTGRMKPGEDPDAALAREFHEELGQTGEIDRKLGVIRCRLTHDGRAADFISHVYLVKKLGREPVPNDTDEQITGFKDVDVADLKTVAEDLRHLSGRWRDWGRFRALAHDFVSDVLGREKKID